MPIERLIEEADRVMKAKQHDYIGDDPDPLAAFRKTAAATGLTVRQVWSVFFMKHVLALGQWANGDTPKEESVFDRLVDVVNYAKFAALIDDEEQA